MDAITLCVCGGIDQVKVVIFCGGLGVRMGEATETIPKPMIPIGTRPILWHIMKWYASWGHTEFVLCLGYRGETIKDYFLTYQEAMSNDFVLSNGGRDVQLLCSDIENWTITFVDTGLHSTIGQRLSWSSPTSATIECSWRPMATGSRMRRSTT